MMKSVITGPRRRRETRWSRSGRHGIRPGTVSIRRDRCHRAWMSASHPRAAQKQTSANRCDGPEADV